MFSIPQQEAEALEQPLRHGVRSPAGNRLESVTNSGSEDAGTFSYTCDSSGNLSFDSRNGLDIQSNVRMMRDFASLILPIAGDGPLPLTMPRTAWSRQAHSCLR